MDWQAFMLITIAFMGGALIFSVLLHNIYSSKIKFLIEKLELTEQQKNWLAEALVNQEQRFLEIKRGGQL